jgi:hypothetical protein
MADVADHISPVYPGMPDSEFFSERNLRASCRPHNIARGFAAGLERDLAGAPETVTRPRFGPARLPRTRVITADYTRREPERGAG